MPAAGKVCSRITVVDDPVSLIQSRCAERGQSVVKAEFLNFRRKYQTKRHCADRAINPLKSWCPRCSIVWTLSKATLNREWPFFVMKERMVSTMTFDWQEYLDRCRKRKKKIAERTKEIDDRVADIGQNPNPTPQEKGELKDLSNTTVPLVAKRW